MLLDRSLRLRHSLKSSHVLMMELVRDYLVMHFDPLRSQLHLLEKALSPFFSFLQIVQPVVLHLIVQVSRIDMVSARVAGNCTRSWTLISQISNRFCGEVDSLRLKTL